MYQTVVVVIQRRHDNGSFTKLKCFPQKYGGYSGSVDTRAVVMFRVFLMGLKFSFSFKLFPFDVFFCGGEIQDLNGTKKPVRVMVLRS